MQLAQYLMCVATRHEQAKYEHIEELQEYRLRVKQSTPRSRKTFTLTYADETALLTAVISSVRGKPPCLKKLSMAAIGSLAFILKAKMANEPFIEGHEIISKLVCDPEKTVRDLDLVEMSDHSIS